MFWPIFWVCWPDTGLCRSKIFSRSLRRYNFTFRLQKFEIPKAIFLVSEPWTPESGLITAAMKLKRKSLDTAFAKEIVEMYAENNNNNNIAK